MPANFDPGISLEPFVTLCKQAPEELVDIPPFDVPAGTPSWMRGTDGWASRVGSTAAEKRRTISVEVHAGIIP
jgi:hypothetical protein